jgi:hypothetical protein
MDFKTFLVVVGLGLFLGLALSVGPVIALDFFDGTARTEKDLQRMTDLVVLESIPVKGSWAKSRNFGKTVDEKLVTADYSHNFADETFRSLRAKILLGLNDTKKKRILITSLGIGEGKSFTAANLAITLAQQKISTLLIDGDLRRGIQYQHFGLPKNPGLSSILLNNVSLSPVLLQRFCSLLISSILNSWVQALPLSIQPNISIHKGFGTLLTFFPMSLR